MIKSKCKCGFYDNHSQSDACLVLQRQLLSDIAKIAEAGVRVNGLYMSGEAFKQDVIQFNNRLLMEIVQEIKGWNQE